MQQIHPAHDPRRLLARQTLPVLLYDEDGRVCAHAVELDLLGYGATDTEALEALSGVILAQYAAAQHYGDPSLIPFSAEPRIVARHRAARDLMLRRLPPQGDRVASLWVPSETAIAEYAETLSACPKP